MKNILITGASGNLGQATVQKFLSEGHRVIATVSSGKALPFKAEGELVTVSADLSNESSVDALTSDIIGRYNSIDAVLLLVGGWAGGTIQDTDGAALKKMFSLNFETLLSGESYKRYSTLKISVTSVLFLINLKSMPPLFKYIGQVGAHIIDFYSH